MKRDIFDLLDGYGEERIDLKGATPLSARRIRARTMSMLRKQGGYGHPGKKEQSRLLRGLFVAAVVGALCCATAFGVLSSLRELARADMGVSPTESVPEWSEYRTTGGEAEKAEPRAELTAALCAGERLYAYLEAGRRPWRRTHRSTNGGPEKSRCPPALPFWSKWATTGRRRPPW